MRFTWVQSYFCSVFIILNYTLFSTSKLIPHIINTFLVELSRYKNIVILNILVYQWIPLLTVRLHWVWNLPSCLDARHFLKLSHRRLEKEKLKVVSTRGKIVVATVWWAKIIGVVWLCYILHFNILIKTIQLNIV